MTIHRGEGTKVDPRRLDRAAQLWLSPLTHYQVASTLMSEFNVTRWTANMYIRTVRRRAAKSFANAKPEQLKAKVEELIFEAWESAGIPSKTSGQPNVSAMAQLIDRLQDLYGLKRVQVDVGGEASIDAAALLAKIQRMRRTDSDAGGDAGSGTPPDADPVDGGGATSG